jgi:hypothetical protein
MFQPETLCALRRHDRVARYLVLKQLRVVCPGSHPSTQNVGNCGFNVVVNSQQFCSAPVIAQHAGTAVASRSKILENSA